MSSILRRALGTAGRAVADVARSQLRRSSGDPSRGQQRRPRRDAGPRGTSSPRDSWGDQQVEASSRETVEYDVARLGLPELEHTPKHDDQPDPGEVVWTWVPYDDDPRQGKDRPVLVVGRHSRTLYGLMLSSRSDRDGQRHWFPLGSGAWDGGRRPSWVRLDRVLTMREDSIRREGAVLDRHRFDLVCRILRSSYGWR
jgi:PemK-like, MazF-like toxin of type II toxin-antitoxin system